MENLLTSLLTLLVIAVVFLAFAWGAHWIITHYFSAPIQTPAFIIVGLIFLIVLLVVFIRWFQGGFPAIVK